jgi:serine/threonine-protein kinase
VAAIVRQVARGLGAAHARGILHRDLKPENIFLSDLTDETLRELPYCAKILDFGVAKVLDDAPSATPRHANGKVSLDGAPVGTLGFMSPEQLLFDTHVGPASDLWALGAVTFEAITGREPFPGRSMGEVTLKICGGELPVPSETADVPPQFDAWFARACAREPNERFHSAREMAAELNRIVHPGRARRQAEIESMVPPLQRLRAASLRPTTPSLPPRIVSPFKITMGAIPPPSTPPAKAPRLSGGLRSASLSLAALVAAIALLVLALGVSAPRLFAPLTHQDPVAAPK